jgi:hypothetical protein
MSNVIGWAMKTVFIRDSLIPATTTSPSKSLPLKDTALHAQNPLTENGLTTYFHNDA